MSGKGGELFIERAGNVFWGGKYFGAKGDGLIGGWGGRFARKGLEEGPVFGWVGVGGV